MSHGFMRAIPPIIRAAAGMASVPILPIAFKIDVRKIRALDRAMQTASHRKASLLSGASPEIPRNRDGQKMHAAATNTVPAENKRADVRRYSRRSSPLRAL